MHHSPEMRARILRAQSKALRRLYQATVRESESLQSRDMEGLDRLLREKAVALSALSNLAERLQKVQSDAENSATNSSAAQNNPKLKADLEKMAELAGEIRRMNIDNQRMIQASRSFFHQFFAGLQEYRARAFGYTRSARGDTHPGKNIFINELR